jgi:hypothetical protein
VNEPEFGDEGFGRMTQKKGLTQPSGPYFTQEYTAGDICDHSDVTDSVIKAGTVKAGVVERSTTVRFYCGRSLELTQVNEDSTCHYVLDVTIPDLCDQPLFKPPVPKRRIVKCLPVENHQPD